MVINSDCSGPLLFAMTTSRECWEPSIPWSQCTAHTHSTHPPLGMGRLHGVVSVSKRDGDVPAHSLVDLPSMGLGRHAFVLPKAVWVGDSGSVRDRCCPLVSSNEAHPLTSFLFGNYHAYGFCSLNTWRTPNFMNEILDFGLWSCGLFVQCWMLIS